MQFWSYAGYRKRIAFVVIRTIRHLVASRSLEGEHKKTSILINDFLVSFVESSLYNKLFLAFWCDLLEYYSKCLRSTRITIVKFSTLLVNVFLLATTKYYNIVFLSSQNSKSYLTLTSIKIVREWTPDVHNMYKELPVYPLQVILDRFSYVRPITH